MKNIKYLHKKIVGNLQLLILLTLVSTHFLAVSAFAAEFKKDPHQYQRLIIFGDSYSDNGNVFQLTNSIVPNPLRYFEGRFANGPSWCEYFAEDLSISPQDSQRFINFAYGGAKILRPVKEIIHGKPNKSYIVPNLSQEIDDYSQKYLAFNSNDLVVVFMGTNDFKPLFHKSVAAFFQPLADQESAQVNRLVKMGAKQIIVFNVRNLIYLPMIQSAKKKSFFPINYSINSYLRYLSRSITYFNQRLSADLAENPQVFIYNTFDFDSNLFAEQKSQVVNHGSLPCYKNYKGDYQNISGSICPNPEEYFFYDRIHTTSAVNYLLAKDVYRQAFY